MEENYIIPETLKFKRQFRFLIFCFFWLFLIVPLSFSSEILKDYVIKVNYILIIVLPLWVYNTIFRKGFRYLPEDARVLLKLVTKYILFFLFLMALQMIINPHNSEFIVFRRLSVSAIPSLSLALLMTFYTIGSQKRQLLMLRIIFIILILIAIFSYIKIGFGNDDNIAYSVYGEIEREKGIIGSVNEYGYYLAFLFVLSIPGFTDRFRIIPYKILYIPILIVTFMLILLTGSYGAIILSLICSMFLLINTSSLKKILSIYIIAPTFVFVVWSGIKIATTGDINWKAKAFNETLTARSITPAYETSTFLLRYELIIDGFQNVLKKSITGHGYANRYAYSLSRDDFVAVHNAFIVESLKGGILIGIIMLLFYFRLFRYCFKIKNRDARLFAFAMLMFMFISDNTATGFTFLSLSSGTLACTLLIMILINDITIQSRSLVSSREY